MNYASIGCQAESALRGAVLSRPRILNGTDDPARDGRNGSREPAHRLATKWAGPRSRAVVIRVLHGVKSGHRRSRDDAIRQFDDRADGRSRAPACADPQPRGLSRRRAGRTRHAESHLRVRLPPRRSPRRLTVVPGRVARSRSLALGHCRGVKERGYQGGRGASTPRYKRSGVRRRPAGTSSPVSSSGTRSPFSTWRAITHR